MKLKFVNIDGRDYISIDDLIKAMTCVAIDGTEVKDPLVCFSESADVEAYQDLLKFIDPSWIAMKDFNEMYKSERFFNRTLGS